MTEVGKVLLSCYREVGPGADRRGTSHLVGYGHSCNCTFLVPVLSAAVSHFYLLCLCCLVCSLTLLSLFGKQGNVNISTIVSSFRGQETGIQLKDLLPRNRTLGKNLTKRYLLKKGMDF